MAAATAAQDKAPETRPPVSLWAVRLSTLLCTALVLCFLVALPVLLGATWIALPALLLLAALLALPLAWLWRRFWHPARAKSWRGTWLRGSTGLWFLLCGLTAAPVYFLAITTETRPAMVPTVTLSNGPRTVVLQGMQHVGAERFYQGVIYDLEKALAEGYVLAYEGVADSDAEADAWFRQTLSHGKDLGDSYRQLGRTCGLSYQIDYFGPLVADAKANPQRHVTMDVNTREMKQEYDRLLHTDADFAAAMRKRDAEQGSHTDEAPDFLTDFIARQEAGGQNQRALVGTLCRGAMTFVMRKASEGDDMNRVVLDFRNRHLATQLLNDSRPKIYVTYGAAHLPGVMKLMQREPGWKVQSVKWMRTIAPPEHLEGSL